MISANITGTVSINAFSLKIKSKIKSAIKINPIMIVKIENILFLLQFRKNRRKTQVLVETENNKEPKQ